MKKVDIWTELTFAIFDLALILESISNYKDSPKLNIVLIILLSYCFLYYIDLFVKRIREKKSPQTPESESDNYVEGALDNWAITAFILLSVAFLLMGILKYRDMPALSIAIIIFEAVIVLICTVERIKRGKAAKQNDSKE